MQVAVRALSAQRAEALALFRDLDEAAWGAACLPGWRVRDVLAHLVAVDEAALTGRLLPRLRTHGRSEIEHWNDQAVQEFAEVAVAELLERLERAGMRLTAVLERLPRVASRVPLRTAFGRQPVSVLVCRRVVDEWVHTVDVARACGRQATLAEAVPPALAVGVLDTLPTLVLPTLRIRAGVVRLVVATGRIGDEHGTRRTWSIDFARRQYGTRVTARPDATVRLHASTLTLLAEGRCNVTALAADDLELDGDEALARAVLTGLVPAPI